MKKNTKTLQQVIQCQYDNPMQRTEEKLNQQCVEASSILAPSQFFFSCLPSSTHRMLSHRHHRLRRPPASDRRRESAHATPVPGAEPRLQIVRQYRVRWKKKGKSHAGVERRDFDTSSDCGQNALQKVAPKTSPAPLPLSLWQQRRVVAVPAGRCR